MRDNNLRYRQAKPRVVELDSEAVSKKPYRLLQKRKKLSRFIISSSVGARKHRDVEGKLQLLYTGSHELKKELELEKAAREQRKVQAKAYAKKQYERLKNLKIRKPRARLLKKKKLIAGAVLVIAGYVLINQVSQNDQGSLEGISTNNQTTTVAGVAIEKPEFSILTPIGKDAESLDHITRRDPNGNTLYTYADSMEDIVFEVTLQKLPESFLKSEASSLESLAKDFQQQNVIVVDGSKIYHGMSEKTGEQFLTTTKKGLLIFIRSKQKLPDDNWAAYLASLN